MAKQIEGQMSIFDFMQQPEEKPSKFKDKKYIPKCCKNCEYWLDECRANTKADHDMCNTWTLRNVPQWWGFLDIQEAVQQLFSNDRLIGNLKFKIDALYQKRKEPSDRIEQLRSFKGLCGQAWMPDDKWLSKAYGGEIFGVTGYASNYTYGLTIRQRNQEGKDLGFGKYIPWEEVDKILMNEKFRINKGQLNGKDN